MTAQTETEKEIEKDYTPKVTMTGVGMFQVKASELIKTKEVKRQIEALRKFKITA